MDQIRRRGLFIALAVAAAAPWSPSPAGAAPEAAPRSYALVVGSNRGGPGQADLRFAERDATNVAAVLRELGGYDRSDTSLLLGPSPAELLAGVDRIARAIESDAAAGRQVRFLFYYSGHARASALSLGGAELSLERLRSRLTAIPATLKIVILDACQSGAFSRVRGVEPAADFSVSSVGRLNAAGMAVMASSSASELSQESERLEAGYFTHHLLVGLRGAADYDDDGRVSLEEAYRYAYLRTLSATARTAVGRQHVTLETDLRGKGEVALTHVLAADAWLELPAGLNGEVLVERRPRDVVVAEVDKARGTPLRLALPSGRYHVLVRAEGTARGCDLHLSPGRSTPLSLDDCRRIDLGAGGTKGAQDRRWAVELGAGGARLRAGAYVDRLEVFGYREGFYIPVHYAASVSYRLGPEIAVVVRGANLGGGHYRRDGDTEESQLDFETHGLGLMLRGTLPLGHGAIEPFAEAGGGLSLGRTSLRRSGDLTQRERHVGYHLEAAAGVFLHPWPRLGFFGRLAVAYAPIIDNLLGDVHDSGGTFASVGFRLAL